MKKLRIQTEGKFRNFLLRFSVALVIIICGAFTVNSQTSRVSGTIIDKTDNQPVIGAFVFLNDLKDTTERVASTTDVNGRFVITGLKRKDYQLTIQSINYQKDSRIITISKSSTDLGTIVLSMESKLLKEVVIVGQGTAVQKGDTTVMTADAFKVNVDANAEDLVKKMPGITVENGTVTARGEEVKKVLVDGKPFFGDDPSVALRNLPADVIDRVQVYNKLSDQAELTGFDDGESSRTINIITRKDSKISQFGKFTAGTDFDNKYLVGGTLSVFKGPRRFTFTGMSNNINQANFAMQDLIGSTGGGGMRMGGGGYRGGGSFGGAKGISQNSSLGFNYQDNWGKKIAVTGSYLFNTTENTLIQEKKTEYLAVEKFSVDSSNSTSSNYNHRVNMRIEYNIDSLNSIIIEPRLSLQNNNSTGFSKGITTMGILSIEALNTTLSEASGYSYGNELTWRHKFMKPGRTLSVRSSISKDNSSSTNSEFASFNAAPDNQYSDNASNSFRVNTRLSYTEPLGKNSQLQLNYNNGFTRSNTDKEVFAMGDQSEVLGRFDSLSNVYDNDYITNRGGTGYLYRKGNFNLSAGIDYQRADLKGTQTFPDHAIVSETFENILPNIMLNYKFSTISNIRLSYRTSTYAPSLTQLQNVINNSNRMSLSTGNPGLKQQYSHNVMTNYSYANPTSGFNTFVFIMGGYTKDVIANKTIYAINDTIVNPAGYDVILLPGNQLRFPVNLDHSMELRTVINFSYFVKPIKSNVSLVLGGNYSQTPGYIDELFNRSNTYGLTNSLIITSNISSNIDFTVSYTSNYSVVKNSANVQSNGGMQNSDNNNYWYQSASAKLNLLLWKGITVNTDVLGTYNQGLSTGYNQRYLVWNASLGKKFLKNKTAELRFGVYDILDQNNSITRTVSAAEIADTRVNTYKRYFLVLFTYNLRAKRGQAAIQQQQQQQQDDHDHPPGMPPGGFRPPGGGPPDGYHDH